jgi:hypothetical protein
MAHGPNKRGYRLPNDRSLPTVVLSLMRCDHLANEASADRHRHRGASPGGAPRHEGPFRPGYARDAIVHHGRLAQGVQLITRPFTFDALAVTVREVLDAAPR